jgi:AraC-like DNA-binding protein
MIGGGLDRRAPECVRLRAGVNTMVLDHPAGQAVREHAHPGWNIAIPRAAGQIGWWTGQGPAWRAAGVIFPPQVAHRVYSGGGHVSVFIDAWYLGLGPGHGRAIPLDHATVEHLRALWSPGDAGDPDRRARQSVALLRRRDLLPPAVAIDPRVRAALPDLAAADCVHQVAAAVGLSPSRLRALIHNQIGTQPARLRMWQRLRTAILSLPAKPIALAACDAGFADQAHLTRTATRLVGQTPGDLARSLAGAPHRHHHHHHRTPALATAA